MHTARLVMLATFAVLFSTQPVGAQFGGTITNATAMYVQTPGPSNETFASPSGITFKPETSGPNQMFQNWWYYRVQGDLREYAFGDYARNAGGTIASTLNDYGLNKATVKWTDTNASSVVRFNATYVSLLSHDGTNAATLDQSFRIDNPGTSALNITLFNYADMDVNGPAVSDTDTVTANSSAITDTDGSFRMVHAVTGSVPANAFQVSQYSGIRDLLLNGNINNLNNSGASFFGDETGAFQWDLTVPAGSFVAVGSAVSIAPIPEPGTLLLTGAVAAGLACRLGKRKRKTLAA